jgi:hypothetical protein
MAWLILGASVHAQETQPAAAGASALREMHGLGSWKAEGKAQRPAQRWNLDAVRLENDELRGRIAVSDSPVIPAGGNVEGRINGETVTGTIVDDAGNQLATFQGTITPGGIQGKYTDKTGEVGEWVWNGELPH